MWAATLAIVGPKTNLGSHRSADKSFSITMDVSSCVLRARPILMCAVFVAQGSVMQHGFLSGAALEGAASQSQHCAPLRDRGSIFTVDVEVGTPPQIFSVVADTGSDALIVTSCVCHEHDRCFPKSRCFKGDGRSSSFSVSHSGMTGDPERVVLGFGSGEVVAVLATDVARVGTVPATMNDSLLLMYDHRLQIQGPFEGILGLGPPHPSSNRPKQVPHGFLRQAGVDRFSLCFNSNGEGALTLGALPATRPLASVGKAHWGVDFQGITVGQTRRALRFCTPQSATLRRGQQTRCGLIPDSGTTLFMAPAAHIAKLVEALCEAWPRCKAAAAKEELMTKQQAFQDLLLNCEGSDWLVNGSGLDELPPFQLHVAGIGELTKQALQINATSYIVMTSVRDMQFMKDAAPQLVGMASTTLPANLAGRSHVCLPAFGEMDYVTAANGPIWIAGLPLFYEFQVGYDRSTAGISFGRGPCTSCSSTGISLATRAARMPRLLSSPPRLPTSFTDIPGSFSMPR